MTAQEPFHHFASRTGGVALLPIDLVTVLHHCDFLTEIVGLFRVGAGRDGHGLAHRIRLRLLARLGKGCRCDDLSLPPTRKFLEKKAPEAAVDATDAFNGRRFGDELLDAGV